MIKSESLSRTFGDFVAVDNISLEIRKGEVFALLGPNGAGKSTTIRMLTGLIAPTSGSCSIEGIDVTQYPTRAHEMVGLLTEVPGLYETLSAKRNLEFYGKMFGVRETELSERIRKLLTEFELWDKRDKAVQTFSKGMKQKIAIIRSLIHDPQYLFLDEPMSGLDPVASRTLKDFILSLKRAGKTIILSTHDLDDADRLSDRVAVVRRNLIALDTPSNLRAKLFNRTIVFRLKTVDDSALDDVAKLPYVKSAKRVENKLVLELDDPEEDNSSVLDFLAGRGYKVQFIGEVRHTLEEAYLRLVAS
jgi:ABC-2 type transport system ATP-binding protein